MTDRPAELETDLWKESLLHNFLLDLDLKSNPRLALPRIFMRTAAYFSSKTALMEKQNGRYRPMSFRDLAEKMLSFAAALIEVGMSQRDCIALLLKNSPAWVISDFGTMMAAGTTVPIYENLISSSILHILRDSETRFIVVEDKSQLQKIQEIWKDLPELKLIIIRNPEGVELTKNIVTFEQFLETGQAHLKRDRDAVSSRMNMLERDDIASIVYTSGTTGNPKGVVLSHGNFIANVLGVASVADVNSLDTFLSFLPLSHAFERTVGYYSPILLGATIAYAESIERIPQNLTEVRPTVCCAVPRIFEKIYARMIRNIESSGIIHRFIFALALAAGGRSWNLYDRLTQDNYANGHTHHRPEDRLKHVKVPSSGPFVQMTNSLSERLVYKKIKQKMGGRLRYFVSGGAALSPELVYFFRNLGITIYEGYGMTETSPIISFNYRHSYEPGTVGKILPNVQVKLSEQGEILAKGPSIMKGYYNNPKATAEIIDEDGWLHTGDIGIFDENKYLKITDRIKELIVMSNGKNVAPLPIESKLSESPWIANSIAIGNGRKFISALLFPNVEELEAFARAEHIPTKSLDELCQNEKIQQIFATHVKNANSELSRYEQIKKFEIVPAVLSIETGELTPTLKIKRRIVEKNFKDYIDKQYKGAA